MKSPSEKPPAKPILILVETMGSANIGSTARTAAAFGLTEFRLVAPRCKVNEESKKWACSGAQLLENIEVFPDLAAALLDVDIAVALSRRVGRYRHRHFNLVSLQDSILPAMVDGAQVAYVFGNEKSGLSRAHLDLCHFSAEIPVLAESGSLNLAHAVTVTLYEVLARPTAKADKPEPKSIHEEAAPLERLQDLLRKSERTLERVGFPREASSLGAEMVKLDRLVQRSGMENWEVRLLLAMIKQVNTRLDDLQSPSGSRA